MLKEKSLVIGLGISLLLGMTGCGKLTLFKEDPPDHAVQVNAKEMDIDHFYIKDGTKFAPVYVPQGNNESEVKVLDQSRVIYFTDDESMLPIHYKNEQIVYCSAETNLFNEGISLERYKDMGYSIGLYGGVIMEDGYYHCQISKNVCANTDAAEVFSYASVDDMRIISIGGNPISELVDEESGIIVGLEKDKAYTMEFYLGSFYYTSPVVADTHMLRAFEYKYYDGNSIQDTKLRYMAFDTPDDMRSGYYNVNNKGVFIYYDYPKGEVPEDVDFNEIYFTTEQEQILQYTRSYNLSVPVDTRDMMISLEYNAEPDKKTSSYSEYSKIDENDIGGYLISPDGTMYDLKVDKDKDKIGISLSYAMAGDWTVNIFPRDLLIVSMDTISSETAEETECEETIMEITEEGTYQAFYVDVRGDIDSNVFGYIIAEDGKTYQFSVEYYQDNLRNKQRYLVYLFPHLSPGNYTVKIYHYTSETSVSKVHLYSYDPTTNELVYEVDVQESDTNKSTEQSE